MFEALAAAATAGLNREDTKTLPPTATNGAKTKPRKKRSKKKKKKKGTTPKQSESSSIGGESNIDDDDSGLDDVLLLNRNSSGGANHSNRNSSGTGSSSNSNSHNGGGAKSSIRQSILNTASSNMLTPQELMRNRLIRDTVFDATCVDVAMEEMWEKGLPFDDYAAVFQYLHLVDDDDEVSPSAAPVAAPTLVNVNSAKPPRPDDDKSRHEDEDGSTEATELIECSPQSTVGIASINSIDLDINVDLNANEHDPEDQEENEEDSEAAPEAAPETPLAPPTTQASKLDLVANHENIGDAIFAMTEWVKRAAKPQDIEDLCIAEKTSALPTIVRRGVSYTESSSRDSNKFETTILPGLVQLLMSVLDRCGVAKELGTEGGEEVEDWLETILEQTRTVCVMQHADTNANSDHDIADRVSRFVVSRISIAMEDIKETTIHNKPRNNNDKPMKHVIITDRNENTATGIFLQRDALKLLAKLACGTVKSSMKKTLSNNEAILENNRNGNESSTFTENREASPSLASSSSTTSLDNQTILLLIVDQVSKNRFEEEQARLETLEAKVRPQGDTSESETVQTLRESVLELQTKRLTYAEKIAELRAALNQLEARDEDASVQLEGLQAQIEDETANDSLRATQLETQIRAARESVAYGTRVGALAGTMKSYGKSLEEATSDKSEKAKPIPINNSISNYTENSNPNGADTTPTMETTSAPDAMEDYLCKVRDYFLAEAGNVAQLRSRVAASTAEVASLRSELDQYRSTKGIGLMTTIIAQIEDTVSNTERSRKVDVCTVDALVRDGQYMYDELIARLEAYQENMAHAPFEVENENDTDTSNNTAALLPNLFPTDLLQDVPAAISALTIGDDSDRLAPFVLDKPPVAAASSATNSEDAPSDGDGTGSASGGNDHDTDSATTHTVPSSPNAIPSAAPAKARKMSWASPKSEMPPASASDGEKRSLLDIQKEQMEQQRKSEMAPASASDDEKRSLLDIQKEQVELQRE